MDATHVDLIVAGNSPCVLGLADGKLDGDVEHRSPIGSKSHSNPLTHNVVIIGIPTKTAAGESVFDSVENWLYRNRAPLIECDADRTLEFYTYLQPDVGSLILKIPHSLIQIASELGLNVSNQAVRIITEDK